MASSSEGHGGDGVNNYSQGAPSDSSPPGQSAPARFTEEWDASRRGSSLVDGPSNGALQRSTSGMSQSQTLTPSRGGTLKKRQSLKRGNSLRRSSSRRSLGAGSVKSLNLGDRERYEGGDFYSAFHTPIPTKGSPTEILANRFLDWRRVLKDLITYFREVQKSHESKAKSLLSLSNLASNMSGPPGFLKEGGVADATNILQQYLKKALSESNKAKQIEDEIMQQLTGLRSDLGQKIKEIKSLSGDFKNSCDKETESTRKAVRSLQEGLGLVDSDPGATSGKGDPFIVKLGVERQLERQIDEENYLHKAFLNLEHSGRELESIVVGEIQKAHNAYAGILKREADEAYETVESLRTGVVAMPKDAEWDAFVNNNDNFVDPRMPLRKPDQISYPGKDAPAAAEVRSGMLERKSKYLKSYTPGWYVLSPTHLHEFKSPDRISAQTPVMSLYLPEQKLGSHSNHDSSSHKFMLKGRQSGGMHRGHGWVFRAESRDTMLAWFEDVKNLTEKTGMERDAFVRKHARSLSQGSMGAASISSDGALDEDEADRVPYSGHNSQLQVEQAAEEKPQRPQPGGRFPSDINVAHHLQMPLSPSSGASSSDDRDAVAAAAAMAGADIPDHSNAISSSDTPDHTNAPAEEYQVRGESYRDEPYMQPDDDLYTSSQQVLISPTTTVQSPTDHRGQDEILRGEAIAATDMPMVAGNSGHNDRSSSAVPYSQQLDTSKDPGEEIPTSHFAPAPAAAPTAVYETADANKRPEPLVAGVSAIPFAAHGSSLTPAEAPVTPATTVTTLSDASLMSTENLAFGAGQPVERPPLAIRESEQTISNLHIPGEFPGVGQRATRDGQ